MIGGNGRLGSAQGRWNDYVGTAAADDAEALLNRRSLYEIAGLDRERWTIAGVDLSMGSTEQVVLYAVDRAAAPAQHDGDGDGVAVTAFHLGPSVRLEEFVREAFKRVTVRLLSTAVENRPLLVIDHARAGEAPQ